MPSALSTSSAVLDLAQARVDVGQRQRREHAEAAGMIADELRGVFVALARERGGLARCRRSIRRAW